MDKGNVLLVGMPVAVEPAVTEALGAQQAVTAVQDAATARALARRTRPAAAAVALGEAPSTEPLELVKELATMGVPVLAVGPRKDADLILAAMRAGAREFLAGPDEAEVGTRMRAILEAAGVLRIGQVTALFPAKGGMGATTLATHLAGALARVGRRACIVDVDLELGDVLAFLDMRGGYSLADVASNVQRLDRELLDASVPRHASGAWVLSQAEKPGSAESMDPGSVTRVLRFLRQQYDELVVDGLRDFGDVSLAALDLADRILLVVTQEVPAVRNARRCVDIFRQLDYDLDRVLVVVNRYHRSSPITREVIEETVGLPVAALVGNDFQALSRAVNRGVLLWDEAPRSVVARDVEALAKVLGPATPPASGGSFLRKLFPARGKLHGAY
jgi:pilus assembly protein CpaE